eukprot:TRINITY_DN5561_c0_g1_i1.p1 TRINITY_DN5561_c0_g1~~TRINITY_DN5561_c0_g1_i1.p1  ORF type:complete len:534 (-),score=113.66 TRINITY_DN5561_c0_g1_i1:42-1643(-)
MNGGILADSSISPALSILDRTNGVGFTFLIHSLRCYFGRYTLFTPRFFFSMCLPSHNHSRVEYSAGNVFIDEDTPVMQFAESSITAENLDPSLIVKQLVENRMSEINEICSKPCRTLFSRPSSLYDQCIMEWLTHPEVKLIVPIKQVNFILKVSPILPRILWGLHLGTYKWMVQEIFPQVKLPSCVLSSLSEFLRPSTTPPAFTFKESKKSSHPNDSTIADSKVVESFVLLLNQSGCVTMFSDYFIDCVSALTTATPSNLKQSKTEFGNFGFPFQTLFYAGSSLQAKLSGYISSAFAGVLTVQEIRRMSKRLFEDWFRKLFTRNLVINQTGTPTHKPINSVQTSLVEQKRDLKDSGKDKVVISNPLWPLAHALFYTFCQSSGKGIFYDQFLSLFEVRHELSSVLQSSGGVRVLLPRPLSAPNRAALSPPPRLSASTPQLNFDQQQKSTPQLSSRSVVSPPISPVIKSMVQTSSSSSSSSSLSSTSLSSSAAVAVVSSGSASGSVGAVSCRSTSRSSAAESMSSLCLSPPDSPR